MAEETYEQERQMTEQVCGRRDMAEGHVGGREMTEGICDWAGM